MEIFDMPMEFQRVVVDMHHPGQDDQPTLDAARQIAQRTGARLWLFHNLYHRRFLDEGKSGDEMLSEARELLMEERKKRMRHWVSQLSDEGIETEFTVLWSEEGWLDLTRYASECEADLVISVARPHTRWERLTLSNDDWQLIRYNSTPLLLVRPGEGHQYNHAMAAIDPLHADDKPASLDQRILEATGLMSSLHPMSLDVVNVVAPMLSAAPTVAEPLLATDTMAQEAVAKAHRKRVDELVDEQGLDGATIQVTVGDPADEIVALAQEHKVDLLIMGAVARSALGRFLIGNTAEKVLDAVDCDLLIIKPESVKSKAVEASSGARG